MRVRFGLNAHDRSGNFKRLDVLCASPWDLFQALVRLRNRPRLYSVRVAHGPYSRMNMWPVAALEGAKPDKVDGWDVMKGAPPRVGFTPATLSDLDSLEGFAVACWERAKWMADHGAIRPYEVDPTPGPTPPPAGA